MTDTDRTQARHLLLRVAYESGFADAVNLHVARRVAHTALVGDQLTAYNDGFTDGRRAIKTASDSYIRGLW